MIIRELVLHNFGVYASTNRFVFHGDKPIVLIAGMNGRGKTTFLEAVLLSLYGSNSFAYNESRYTTFGQYLKSYVNTSDGTLETYVDLEFSLESEIYRVHREWSGSKQRVSEKIRVFKDGEYNQFLTENWSMFIENVLPSGLSSFFFFDGEKIAEIAVDETSRQMKESIKTLLGISVLDHLESNLKRVINRTTKNRIVSTEEKKIEYLRDQKEKAEKALERADTDLNELIIKKERLGQKLEKKRQEYSLKGGDIIAQRQDLFQRRTELSSRKELLKEQLITNAASELPLIMVQDLLRTLRESAEINQEQKIVAEAIKRMKRVFPEFSLVNSQDKDAVERFISYIEKKTGSDYNPSQITISDNSLFKLQTLLDEQLLRTKHLISEKQKEHSEIQKRIAELDSYISVEVDEKVITDIFRQIKELEQSLIEIDVLIKRKTEERRKYNGEVITTTSMFNKNVEAYLRSVELNEDGDRIIKYSHMATVILEKYKIRLQKEKVSIVAQTMTDCYKQLESKKNLINRIEMDPVSLDLIYYNSEGEKVNKASLSAGEKQLTVISLLWALALCSKKKLPVIIDTPLSRLDSIHRVSLIQTYFPKASEQTIILSTDSEIDHNYYNLMKDNVGDEYTLVYDDETKSTTIHSGYFREELI